MESIIGCYHARNNDVETSVLCVVCWYDGNLDSYFRKCPCLTTMAGWAGWLAADVCRMNSIRGDADARQWPLNERVITLI